MLILYINDIGQHTSSTIRLFADDCLLYRVIHNACDALELQKDLEQMCSWAKTGLPLGFLPGVAETFSRGCTRRKKVKGQSKIL